MQSNVNLFKDIQNGNKHAFEVLFKTYYSSLCAYANSIIQDVDSSQDIVQEFLFTIWKNKEKLPVEIPYRPYLFKSVHNACLNYIKHKKIEIKHKDSFIAEPISNNYEEHYKEPDSLHEKLRNSIDKLPTERKKIFIMHKYEELKYKEIAEKLDISIKTVENQISKALQFLREEFKNISPTTLLVLIVVIIKFFKIK